MNTQPPSSDLTREVATAAECQWNLTVLIPTGGLNQAVQPSQCASLNYDRSGVERVSRRVDRAIAIVGPDSDFD